MIARRRALVAVLTLAVLLPATVEPADAGIACQYVGVFSLPSGIPISGVEIAVLEAGYFTRSDVNGRYTVPIQGTGTFPISAILTGHTPLIHRIQIGPNCPVLRQSDEGGDRLPTAVTMATPRTAPLPTAAPTLPSSQPAPAGRTLLTDNFDNSAAGVLPEDVIPELVRAYDGGEYVIRMRDPNYGAAVAALPGSFIDTTLTVDVRLVGETSDRFALLECRISEGGGYRLIVDPSDGFIRLSRRGEHPEALVERNTSAVNFGVASNHVELSCIGRTITARVNGTQVAVAQDSAFRAGRLRIGVGTYSDNPVPVEGRFDNLVVTQPAP